MQIKSSLLPSGPRSQSRIVSIRRGEEWLNVSLSDQMDLREGKLNMPHYDIPPMQIAMPQRKGVPAVVWMRYKITPLALYTLKYVLGCQIGKPILFELCFIS